MTTSKIRNLDEGGDSDAAIGSRLELIRLGLGMTQARFAATINVSPRSYHHYEKGTRSISTEVLRQLRDIHHLDFNWVLSGRGFPKDGEDAEALADFISELRQHLAATRTELRPENEGKIAARWLHALRDGRRLEMLDIRYWVDLLKE